MSGLSQCPLFMAAVVAMCGVGLIVFSSVWPDGNVGGEPHEREPSKDIYDRHLRAFAALRRAGMSGALEVVDFGDGLGLGVGQSVSAGAVLFRFPDNLGLDVERERSCLPGSELTEHGSSTDAVRLHCEMERAIIKAVDDGEVSRLTGLVALLVLERRRSLAPSSTEQAVAAVSLAVLPKLAWQTENGLFAVDEDEFNLFSVGTSMEGWQQAAINETDRARELLRRLEAPDPRADAFLEEVRWAYLMLHAHQQWEAPDDISDVAIEFPSQARLLWPLLLARPTPEWQHGVQLKHDSDKRVYEVVTTRAMRYGEEIHYVDRRLSDASAFCFRGLQLVGHHRARLSLNVSSVSRDPLAQPFLDKYGCGTQPLILYVQAQKVVDPHFISCMRMLALSRNVSKLQRAENAGWTQRWPATGLVDRKTETLAAELAISALQQALTRLSNANTEIRQRFGGDLLVARPTVRVREAETTLIVGLLKSVKELQLVSSNEYLFDALRDTQSGGKKVSKKKTSR
eukprot:TRINITY_DN44235_c0_g1_i1.p1 TRINITY_DN44235_c0_g1~~TRINITY_DN44235_c0_g1_i1.p1  ORF type:complete len:513 (+),score=79.63 TRINITY_DN44235_c0_g1_i1:120-1658(+)